MNLISELHSIMLQCSWKSCGGRRNLFPLDETLRQNGLCSAAGNLAEAHFDLHTFAALKIIPLKPGAVPTSKG